jgi:hypothetical protein
VGCRRRHGRRSRRRRRSSRNRLRHPLAHGRHQWPVGFRRLKHQFEPARAEELDGRERQEARARWTLERLDVDCTTDRLSGYSIFEHE